MRIRPRYLLVALLAIPLADIVFLLWVATNLLTPVQTVAVVVLTGLVGMLLVRAEGRHTLRSVQRKLASGEVPTGELLDGGLLIAAGAFLLTPGIVTDAIGFLLALPPTRYPIREALRRYVVVPYVDTQMDGFATGNVWTAGFPSGDGDGMGGFGVDADGGHTRTDTATREGEDFVDVDFEEVDDDADRDAERER